MYKALVARVRYHIQKANFMGLEEAESTLLLGEAADAIEGLQQIANKLLEKYQEEATSVIWEYSGNIAEDIDRLNEEVRILMAQINGMPLPQPPKEET